MLTTIKEILNTKTNNIFHKYIYFSAILSIFLYFNLLKIDLSYLKNYYIINFINENHYKIIELYLFSLKLLGILFLFHILKYKIYPIIYIFYKGSLHNNNSIDELIYFFSNLTSNIFFITYPLYKVKILNFNFDIIKILHNLSFNLGSIFLFIGLSILLINICIYLISIFLPNKK